MRSYSVASVVVLSLGLCGCPIVGQQSAPARAQEAATELNVNTRFGRMELAAERVAPTARDAFVEHRKAWGANVRVADYEVASFKMKGEADAEMLVKVAWYRLDQGDLRTTTLKQQWHDFKGDWKLVEENRADGDVGLIGEPAPAPAPIASGAPRNARFPTIRLGGDDVNDRQESGDTTTAPSASIEDDRTKPPAPPSAH